MKKTVGLMFLMALATVTVASAAESPDARIAALEDKQAITELLTGTYPRALDEAKWADYAALFTTEGELSFAGQNLKGPAAIQKFFASQAPSANGRTLHVVTNLSFNVNADTATGGAYWQTTGLKDGNPSVLSAGRYEDVLKKVNGRWKFAKRAIVVDIVPVPAIRPAATTSK